MTSMIPSRRKLAKGKVLAGVMTVLSAAALGSPVAAGAAPRYPDLRMLSPANIQFLEFQGTFSLRFTTRPANMGDGPLELRRTPTASGPAEVHQRIYEDPVGFRDERIGSSVIDLPTAFTFAAPNIARYELWTQRGFERASARNFTRGQPLYANPPVSHCLADREPLEEGETQGRYVECTSLVMGVSVGWSDVTGFFDDGQGFELGTSVLPDGEYVVRVIVDPDNVLFESEGKADPARESEVASDAFSFFRVANGQIAGIE